MRANLSMPESWLLPGYRSPAPATSYRRKADLARAILDENTPLVESLGGSDLPQSAATLDAINDTLELRGKRAARTIGQAIWAAIPPVRRGQPYSLDNVRWDLLDQVLVDAHVDDRWRLPDVAYGGEALAGGEAAYYSGMAAEHAEARREARTGTGYPLTGRRCRLGPLLSSRVCGREGAEAVDVVYRPRCPSGKRPSVHLPPDTSPGDVDRAALRQRTCSAARANPSLAPRVHDGNSLVDRPPRRRQARSNSGGSEMAETALLINPSRRRRRRRSHTNPPRRRRRRRANPSFYRGHHFRRRRSYRHNPIAGNHTGGVILGGVIHGFGLNLLRRAFFIGKTGDGEKVAAHNFRKWAPALDGLIGAAGFAMARYSRMGLIRGMGIAMLASSVSGVSGALTRNIGMTDTEIAAGKAEDDAAAKIEATMTGMGLGAMLVARDRELRGLGAGEAAGGDARDEMQGDDDLEGDDDGDDDGEGMGYGVAMDGFGYGVVEA